MQFSLIKRIYVSAVFAVTLVSATMFVGSYQSAIAASAIEPGIGAPGVIHKGQGKALRAASGAGSAATVADYLRANGFSNDTLSGLNQVSSSSRSSGASVTFEQTVDGLTVYGSRIKALFNAAGDLVGLSQNLVPAGPMTAVQISPRAALDAALDSLHPGVGGGLSAQGGNANASVFGGSDFFYRDPTVTLIAVPQGNGGLAEGYLVMTWSNDDNQLNYSVVSGTGQVLYVQNRTANDSYRVFLEYPGATNSPNQTIVNGPASGDSESPDGWLDADFSQRNIDISGNNVNAYLDTDNNGAADDGGEGASDAFEATADLGIDPSDSGNQAVAVQNLFYLNNEIHDVLYRHGFTESTKNFQNFNFGEGGGQNDAVNAEAQDGGGTNNANFATPADGTSPRMQMFIFTRSTPRRDGDLDGDIVWHEYGHGLTWRMIDNMAGIMGGPMGEGMSDVLALVMYDSPIVGEYAWNDVVDGIRRTSYEGWLDSNYGRTYENFRTGEVHSDGEFFAAIMWKVWTLNRADGLTSDEMMADIVGGMRDIDYLYRPSFPDYRDGMLMAIGGSANPAASPADPAVLKRWCNVWDGFATHGVGTDQVTTKTIRGRNLFWGWTEGFATPAACQGPPANQPPTAAFTISGSGADWTFTDTSADSDGTIASWDWDFGDETGSTAKVPGLHHYADGTYQVTLTVTDDDGDSDSVTHLVVVDTINDPPVAAFTSSCTGLTCTFTNTSMDDGALTWLWEFGDTTTSTAQNPQHTYAVAGDYTVTLTVDDGTNTPVAISHGVTVSEPSNLTMHIGGLADNSSDAGRRWTASVMITIHDSLEALVEGATVSGTWSDGVKGGGSCTTDVTGQCSVSKGAKDSSPSATFSVSGVSHISLSYDSGDNDGGASVDVDQP